MAYYWAVRARITLIITVPMQPDLTGHLDWSRWNRDVVQRFELDGVVTFPGRAETQHLGDFAEDNGLRVWRVKESRRG